jgi:hypothetical protein
LRLDIERTTSTHPPPSRAALRAAKTPFAA